MKNIETITADMAHEMLLEAASKADAVKGKECEKRFNAHLQMYI